jgi:hypothetical protein
MVSVHGKRRGGKKGGVPAAPLILGAVKSFMGHCETAAGVMGLLQPLVALVQLQTSKAGPITRSAFNFHFSNIEG